MSKLVFFESTAREKAFFSSRFSRGATFSSSLLTPRNASRYRDAQMICVFVHSQLNEAVLSKFTRLKLIVTRSTGYDHIDLAYCKKHGIRVCNVPAYGIATVAEHTFALILGLSRKLIACYERTKEGKFTQDGLEGFDLSGKTLGLIGCGKIGAHVAQIARGFGMKVLVYDLYKDAQLAKKIGFTYASLRRVLERSDAVSLHVPYNKHTHHLISSKELALMKKDALLINTARGAVIDTTALVRSLERGEIGGAGLDVLEGECSLMEEAQLKSKHYLEQCKQDVIDADHALLKMNHVLITPHNAFHTKEALARIMETSARCLEKFSKGTTINRVV